MKTIFKTVLLIDDNEVSNELQKELMQSAGFAGNIIVKQSGAEALDYLKSEVTPATVPEIIFLDMLMPEMDGFSFFE